MYSKPVDESIDQQFNHGYLADFLYPVRSWLLCYDDEWWKTMTTKDSNKRRLICLYLFVLFHPVLGVIVRLYAGYGEKWTVPKKQK